VRQCADLTYSLDRVPSQWIDFILNLLDFIHEALWLHSPIISKNPLKASAREGRGGFWTPLDNEARLIVVIPDGLRYVVGDNLCARGRDQIPFTCHPAFNESGAHPADLSKHDAKGELLALRVWAHGKAGSQPSVTNGVINRKIGRTCVDAAVCYRRVTIANGQDQANGGICASPLAAWAPPAPRFLGGRWMPCFDNIFNPLGWLVQR
jgi:hypothetical protein